MNIIILGAGLAGLSTAYHLELNGITNYHIFEKESYTGGLCHSFRKGGFTFDYTGHLLHTKTDCVKELITKLLKDNVVVNTRNSWIYSKGIYTRYPFQANLYGLPQEVICECLLSFTRAYYSDDSGKAIERYESFEDWILSNLGEGIAKHFMIPYNTKLWTVHPREMTCDWMGQFVPKPNIEQVFRGALMDKADDLGYNVEFIYPKIGGIQALIDGFAAKVKNLYLNKRATKIHFEPKKVKFADGSNVDYDVLVSTVPIKSLMKMMPDSPVDLYEAAARLRCNSVLNVNLGINRPEITDKHWIYFPEEKYVFYRVGFPMNFSPYMTPPGMSSMYIEVSYPQGEQIDKGEVANRCIDDLIEIGILRNRNEIITQLILDIKHAYVIYDKNRKLILDVIQKFLQEHNIYSIGRYGSWGYSSMEDAILVGKGTAEKLSVMDKI